MWVLEAGMPCNEGGLLHVRESWIQSWETIGRQKCGKVRDYDREVRPWERRIVEKEF